MGDMDFKYGKGFNYFIKCMYFYFYLLKVV